MERKKPGPRITVFAHLFYPSLFNEILPFLLGLSEYNVHHYINVGSDFSVDQVQNQIRKALPSCFLLQSPNKGKDIGGKLALLELYIQLKETSDYFIFIHDKLSPQLLNGDKWRNQLLRILEVKAIKEILQLFETASDIGIIGSKEHISNEYNQETSSFESTNDQLLQGYIQELGLKNKQFPFIAGNMFWIRSSIFESFFKIHPPLLLRSGLEPGNVTDTDKGTRTHSLERIFSWIALDQGYRIKGI